MQVSLGSLGEESSTEKMSLSDWLVACLWDISLIDGDPCGRVRLTVGSATTPGQVVLGHISKLSNS